METINPIWVTGISGFLGRAIARNLGSKGHQIVGLGHGFALGRRVDHSDFAGVVGGINGEVSADNLDLLSRQYGRPSAIVHLAGGSSVGLSLNQPAEDFRRTVGSTAALAEWMRLNCSQVPLVYSSSAAVYGTAFAGSIKEDVPLAPMSPYGFGKQIAEMTLRSYALNFGLQVRIVRFFSIYGPGLRKQLLWDACRRLSSGGFPTFFGDGLDQRDWLYVDDAAAILSMCIFNTELPSYFTVNGGTGISTPVKTVLGLLAERISYLDSIQFNGDKRDGDPRHLVADIQLLESLGFSATVDLPAGLNKYVAWYRETDL